MKTSKMILAAVAALALSAPPALAYEAECAWNNETRLIKVNYDPAPEILCEVTYGVNGGGESRLWWANAERDFCEKRARELADKFRNEAGAECAEKSGG